MCINTKYSMSIIKKVFHYEENKISVIKCNDEIWFRGKSVAQSLGYLKPLKALHTHVDKEDKRKLSDLEGVPQNGVHLRLGVTQNGVHLNLQSGCLFINKSGLYSLILRSKLESAKVFKRWVTKDVLPSIRKTGRYDYCIDHKYNNTLTFKIAQALHGLAPKCELINMHELIKKSTNNYVTLLPLENGINLNTKG